MAVWLENTLLVMVSAGMKMFLLSTKFRLFPPSVYIFLSFNYTSSINYFLWKVITLKGYSSINYFLWKVITLKGWHIFIWLSNEIMTCPKFSVVFIFLFFYFSSKVMVSQKFSCIHYIARSLRLFENFPFSFV